MNSVRSTWLALWSTMVNPARAMRDAVDRPCAASVGVALLVAAALLGVATLPRQLAILEQVLSSPDPMVQLHYEAMRSGLTRLIWIDRVVAQPSLIVAALLVVLIADPLLSLPADRKRGLVSVAVLGLAPILVHQIGELAVTYLVHLGSHPTPGDAISLPHGFSTGAKLLRSATAPAPQWLEILDSRANLITLWSVVLWSIGLRAVERSRFGPVHIAIPLAALVCAGTLTWLSAPAAISLVLGRP